MVCEGLTSFGRNQPGDARTQFWRWDRTYRHECLDQTGRMRAVWGGIIRHRNSGPSLHNYVPHPYLWSNRTETDHPTRPQTRFVPLAKPYDHPERSLFTNCADGVDHCPGTWSRRRKRIVVAPEVRVVSVPLSPCVAGTP